MESLVEPAHDLIYHLYFVSNDNRIITNFIYASEIRDDILNYTLRGLCLEFALINVPIEQ
jgi:hypothetical protein